MKKEVEVSDPDKFKEKGNSFFQKAQYKEAIQCYTQAIEVCSKKFREKLSIYFANRSNCYLHLGEVQNALEDANRSVTNNRIWWKAYLRKANVLYKMNELSQALEEIEKAIGLESENKELNDFHQRLLVEIRKKKEKVEQKEKTQPFNPDSLMDNKNITEVVIEDFHEEYLEAYPQEKAHYNILKEAHHGVKQLNLYEYVILNTDNDYHINKEYLLSRFGVVGVDLDKFVRGKDVGNIIKEKNEFKAKFLERDKASLCINSFAHNPPFIDYLLTHGRTYAIINPYDLNILINFQVNPPVKDESINIHVYESCPFSYSKSLIILDMIRRNVSNLQIIQVWYSSGWSKETEKEFIISCENVLKTYEHSNEVKTIIEYWIRSDTVNLQEAKDSWLRKTNLHRHIFYNFKEKKDRLEVIRYILTGELLATDVGSRTMFLSPYEDYKRCEDENIIHSINLSNVEFQDNSTFLSSLTAHLLKKLNFVQKYLQENKIKVTMFFKDISPKNIQYINTLKSNNYWIIYWSNLCDYYSRENFHKMAKAISSQDTIHSIYSVYWYQEVYGTEIYDYHSSSRRKMMEKVNLALDWSRDTIKNTTLIKKVKEKPVASLQQRFLFMSKAMLREKWSDFYFECMNRSNKCAFLSYFGFNSMETTIYLSFSFNNGINLKDPTDFVERV